MSTPRILVTPRSLTAQGIDTVPELEPLRQAGFSLVSGPPGRTPSAAELERLLPGCVGYLAGVETISAPTLLAATSLKVISRNGVGTDAIDMNAAAERGITVRIATAANAQGVAELTLLHTLQALRHFHETMTSVRAGGWARTRGSEIHGTTVGVIGYGQIGRRVARMFAACGAEVLASDPYAAGDEHATLVSIDELLERSSIITLHAPPADRPLIDALALGRVRHGALLVNTARSALVDDTAVCAALESGTLRGYAVDAFDEEPPSPSPLLHHPRTYPTAHIGGYTSESVSRASSTAVQNLLDELLSRDDLDGVGAS